MVEATTTSQQQQPRKLRILCLHGYNNTSEVMMYQMQNFINTMGELCDFSFIEGPRNATDPPIKYFVDKGIVPPYKKWMTMRYAPTRALPDGSTEPAISKTQVNFENVIESVLFIFDFINQQKEPFDGIAGFSQGVYQMQALFKCHQYFKRRLRLKHPMPFFAIDFNGPFWRIISYEFLKSSFISADIFIPNCESLHFVSDKDPMRFYLTNYLNYENPTVISHTQGHRPVRTLPKKKLRQMADFFVRQYERKNGLATEQATVKAILDSFYASLRTSSMLPYKGKKLSKAMGAAVKEEAPRPKL